MEWGLTALPADDVEAEAKPAPSRMPPLDAQWWSKQLGLPLEAA